MSLAVGFVKESKAPADHTPADLSNGLLPLLVDCSLAQAQHITIRRAMLTMKTNPAITHTLLARLCHDTAERLNGFCIFEFQFHHWKFGN